MTSPNVLITDSGPVRTLTLHRPERRNALTPAMQEELIAAFAAVAVSPHVRIVVLTGSGVSFCAGLDLTALEAMAGKSPAELDADAARIARMFRAVYDCPVPTLAAVNGPAIAGGAGLATICDLTLAVPTAKFAYTEVKIGFVPALVSAYLALQVGDKRARDLLLTARAIDAVEAQAFGLVNEVVEPEHLAERTEALARTLLANSPESLRATKRLLAEQNRAWLDHALAASVAVNARTRESPDFAEGIRSFLEKRKPQWTA